MVMRISRKIISVLICTVFMTTVCLSFSSCGKKKNKKESDDLSTSVKDDTTTSGSATTETDPTTTAPDPTTTEDPSASDTDPSDDNGGYSIGPTRATEAPEYGDSRMAELCELMHSVTGKRVSQAVPLIEEYFQARLGDSSMGLHTSYEEDPNGEDFYSYYFYPTAVNGEFEFNEIVLTSNEEHGIAHTVTFTNSNSKIDTSITPTDHTHEEMCEYYSSMEKALADLFGSPVRTQPLNPSAKYGWFYSQFESSGECAFRVEMNANGDYDKVYIECANSVERKHMIKQSDHESSSPDDDVDVGEMYYKEAAPEDIVTDEKSHVRYVKNQLLVSFTMGTPDAKKKMEDICKEIDAEIVGYIEFTSDFQIEFSSDKTYDELMKIGEELTEKYYFILRVDVNYAIDYQVNDED